MARRAMALTDFKLAGPAIHLALPECFEKLSTYLNIFINIFIFFKVNHRKTNKLTLTINIWILYYKPKLMSIKMIDYKIPSRLTPILSYYLIIFFPTCFYYNFYKLL